MSGGRLAGHAYGESSSSSSTSSLFPLTKQTVDVSVTSALQLDKDDVAIAGPSSRWIILDAGTANPSLTPNVTGLDSSLYAEGDLVLVTAAGHGINLACLNAGSQSANQMALAAFKDVTLSPADISNSGNNVAHGVWLLFDGTLWVMVGPYYNVAA